MSVLPNYVSVATLNCQGITNKHKISIFRQKLQDLELVCLQETHFKNDMDSDEFDRPLVFKNWSIFLPGFEYI